MPTISCHTCGKPWDDADLQRCPTCGAPPLDAAAAAAVGQQSAAGRAGIPAHAAQVDRVLELLAKRRPLTGDTLARAERVARLADTMSFLVLAAGSLVAILELVLFSGAGAGWLILIVACTAVATATSWALLSAASLVTAYVVRQGG